jgi:hypothetical protein
MRVPILTLAMLTGASSTQVKGISDDHLSQIVYMHTGFTLAEYLEQLRKSVYGSKTDSPEASRAKELGFLF